LTLIQDAEIEAKSVIRANELHGLQDRINHSLATVQTLSLHPQPKSELHGLPTTKKETLETGVALVSHSFRILPHMLLKHHHLLTQLRLQIDETKLLLHPHHPTS